MHNDMYQELHNDLPYQKELDYLLRVLQKMHIRSRILSVDTVEKKAEPGLHYILGLSAAAEHPLYRSLQHSRENTVYRITDSFRCHYIFFRLPATEDQGLVAGPFLAREMTREELLELAEFFSLPTARLPLLDGYFTGIPVVADQTALITMFISLGELMWGSSEAFEIVDAEQELYGSQLPLPEAPAAEPDDDMLYRMRMMERRYAFENELMDLVAQGHHHRAELLLSNLTGAAFEQRTSDPVRNIKNYGIIFNTLLRKAAERGGVHPIHLDSLSSYFARRIESAAGAAVGQKLMLEMVRAYCRLVRKHNDSAYSAPVQKAIAYIEADLSGDLSLRTLAEAQNISPGYLSALFHKETGKTLTAYVTERRIELGTRLLRTTRLQVQTVAAHCGISDVNYFSKLFKKSRGLTPKQFREQAAARQRRHS